MMKRGEKIGLNNSDIWCTIPKVSNPLYYIAYTYKDKKVLLEIGFRKNHIEIDITDRCGSNGCPLAICTTCVNFKNLDWDEIYNKYIKRELKK